MTFDEALDQVRELLRQRGRVTYRSLKLRYQLDDELLAGITDELIKAECVAMDENGEVLVWVGNTEEVKGKRITDKGGNSVGSPESRIQSQETRPPALSSQSLAERRQLTVMFCDLVGSTALSAQLDPEELREVVQAYQETCTKIIQRYDGYIAQHLGDGLLVYFGYPVAHEDDAVRAVRTGLEILSAMREKVPSPLVGEGQGEGVGRSLRSLQVRIGIHTGLVVIGEIGSSEKREILALGETPNIAARIQGTANPDEVMISAATHRLVEGLFDTEDRGQPELKGIVTPLTLYRVSKESDIHSRFEVVVRKGLTLLVGREHEYGLLHERWQRVKDGAGQVVLLSGEAGIGKSRLVQELKDVVSREGAIRIEFRCSPYHQNSAFYPILDHLLHLLKFAPEDTPQSKLAKLQQALARYRFPQAETLTLLAALLSLPQPDGLPPLTWSPQKQKEKTQETLVAWVVEETERQAVYLVWEDLHWIDPSSLAVLTLILQQVPTSRALVVLTYRPDFTPPWPARAHSTQLTLGRLGQQHVTAMVNQVTATTLLSAEVIQQIVSKTDGVPLFVEELTKSVIEALGTQNRTPLQVIAIPATLQDSLMARLDRLGPAKDIAQLGATIGREFSYELLRAVSLVNEGTLQQGLEQLVDAELVYQRGLAPQAHYLFKHALIQDTAYQSLLKSRRQQLHQTIGTVLEEQFPETKEAQSELLAHHYTEAGLAEQAILYWHKAGQRATQHSAYVEAIAHLTKGLAVLKALPDTPERAQQELTLQLALNDALVAIKGYTAPEVEKTVLRARGLCQQLGETPQLFPVLFRLWVFYIMRRELQTARELAELLLRLAQSVQDLYFLSLAHAALGITLYWLAELISARPHLEQAITLYNPQKHPRFTVGTADHRVDCLSYAAWTLWYLGYLDQALKRSHEAIALAEGLSHPFSLAYALMCAALLHLLRREWPLAQEQAETVMKLATEQGFPFWVPQGAIVQGWALTEQGQVKEGIAQMQQGLTGYQAMGAETERLGFLPLLAEAYAKGKQVEEGLNVLPKALAFVNKTGIRRHEAELYRLKGELTLQQENREQRARSREKKSEKQNPQSQILDPESEAEACFLKAIDITRKQQTKSLELRASTSLARLWQQQGKKAEAHKLLSEIYNWFTEGFDTKDLQEAKALLEELSA